mgnify:FL=1
MNAFNKVILMGNLTRDPELRYTPKGTAVAKLSLALNRKHTDKDGQTVEETTFVDVDAFGKTAETIGQYMQKGRAILLEGRLKLDEWEDQATGKRRHKLNVILERFNFVGGKSDNSAPSKEPANKSPIDDADVPF